MRIISIILLLFCFVGLKAQDTFSIIAVDSVTAEVGSAGASCVGYTTTYPHGAQIISDVIPGIGAVHTQASWLALNQQHAHTRLLAGDSAQQIINYLVANDAQGSALSRQYGVVCLNNGHPQAASFTGANCLTYKNDTSHIYYSVQGNILLGQQVIDSILSRFLNTSGPLSVRLMAALQGAKMVGADTRCASPYNASSMSSFIRVARPTDITGSFYLDLWMSYPQTWSGGAVPKDPIDSLQTKFDNWFVTSSIQNTYSPPIAVNVYQESDGNVAVYVTGKDAFNKYEISMYDVSGRCLSQQQFTGNKASLNPGIHLESGLYLYVLRQVSTNFMIKGKFVSLRD